LTNLLFFGTETGPSGSDNLLIADKIFENPLMLLRLAARADGCGIVTQEM